MAAGNATIGALRVVLGADTADLDKGLKSSQASIVAFAAAVGGAAGVVANKLIEMGSSLAGAFTKIIDDMEKLNKESQKLGVPVEELSKLAFAADLADVSFEGLSKGMVKLSKAISSAIVDPSNEAARAFTALGVSLNDLKTKSPDEIFGKLAGRFSELQDGAGKTAAAVALFGRAGADLIPLLNEGQDGLKKLKDEAQQFGLVITAGTAKAAEDFNDSLKRLGAITKGVFAQALADVLPTMAAFAEQLVEAKKNSAFLEVASIALSTGLKTILTVVIQANALFNQLTTSVSTLLTALAFAATGGFAAALDVINKGLANAGAESTKAGQQIRDLWSGQTKQANEAAVAADNAAKGQEKFNFAALAGKNAVDQFIASQQKGLATRQAEIATFGQLAGVQAAAKIQLDAEAIAKANNIVLTTAQIAKINELAAAYGAAATQLQGLQVTQQNLTPAEQLIKQQTDLKALFDAGAISAETYGRAIQKAGETAKATWDIAGASIAGSFKDIAGAFSKENKGMLVAAQIFGAIQATISMFTGAAKALELPFPANLAAVATVLAKGAALVASIKSQSIPSGLAMGGAFKVPGGIGGGDKVPFSTVLEPGEMIRVDSNNAEGFQSGGRGGGDRVIEIRTAGQKLFPIETVKEIIEGINDAVGFGVKIRTV